MQEWKAVAPDEVLYRSVRASEIVVDADGTITSLSSQAFADRNWRVSLDRANLCTPEQARRDATQFVVQLTARDVRAIAGVTHNETTFLIEVLPAPLPHNPAHAEVIGVPELTQTAFDKLKRKLVQLARQTKIALRPVS